MTMWQRIKTWAHDSETIFLARLQFVVGLVLTAMTTFDPSALQPIIGNKWFGLFLLLWAVILEYARRRRDPELDKTAAPSAPSAPQQPAVTQ
jgi:hypothetical protein